MEQLQHGWSLCGEIEMSIVLFCFIWINVPPTGSSATCHKKKQWSILNFDLKSIQNSNFKVFWIYFCLVISMCIVLSEVQLNESWISHLQTHCKIHVMLLTKFWSEIIDILHENSCLLRDASRRRVQNRPLCFWRNECLLTHCWSI